MACNCGRRRINGGLTSVNQPESQTTASTVKPPTQQTTPTARSRVEAARARVAEAAR